MMAKVYRNDNLSQRRPLKDYASNLGKVVVHTGNGHGSTNNKIRRFTTIQENVGSNITYADNAANGASFTINKSGYYCITYSDYRSTIVSQLGISKDSSQLTTQIDSVNIANRLAIGCAEVGLAGQVSVTTYLAAGSVIRAHTDGTLDSVDNRCYFSIEEIPING